MVWRPECVTSGRTKPICPPTVVPFFSGACGAVFSCACTSAPVLTKAVASTVNTMDAVFIYVYSSAWVGFCVRVLYLLLLFGLKPHTQRNPITSVFGRLQPVGLHERHIRAGRKSFKRRSN